MDCASHSVLFQINASNFQETNRLTRNRTNHSLFSRLGQTLAIALLLGLASGITWAQSAPPDMDFKSGGTTQLRAEGNSLMRGDMPGSFSGRIRGGKVTALSTNLDPKNDGPAGSIIMFDEESPLSQIVARWHTVSNGKKLVLTNVPARVWVKGYVAQSLGAATVELTFENNGKGRAIVNYRHKNFSSNPNRPNPVNGLICNCRVLTDPLSYTLK